MTDKAHWPSRLRRSSVVVASVLLSGVLGGMVSAHALPEQGRLIVVAPNGDDADPGTLDRPLRAIQRAVDLAAPGDVITIRGGTYTLAVNVQVLKSGTAGKPITMTAHQGERVVIDGEKLPASHTPVGGSIPREQRGAIHQEASYWRYYGLEIIRGPYGIYCSGCNDTVFERLVTRDNYESGVQIQGTSSRNLVLNLDSYGNRDPRKNGESADGLAIKEGSGAGNVVRGARLWNNVDDGFDAWKFLSPILLENTIAYGNGVNRWGFPDFAGDGNGFKLGGGATQPVAHTVRNGMAFDNVATGFTDNSNPGAMVLVRNSAYRNGKAGFDFDSSKSSLTANLSVANRVAVSLGSSTGRENSWDIGGTWSAVSLVSTDPGVIKGPRTSTGAIPTSSFLRPKSYPLLGAAI